MSVQRAHLDKSYLQGAPTGAIATPNLESLGELRSVEIWMGLTQPEGLCCVIFFRRQVLARTGYPAAASFFCSFPSDRQVSLRTLAQGIPSCFESSTLVMPST